MFLVGNLVVAFASAIVPLLVAIVHVDHLRHLYGETLAYTPIVGEIYTWLSGFALFAFLMTLVREMIKDMEDIEGDREMECRTMAIVWGEKWTKIVATALIVGIMALIAYIGWIVLPFPTAWNTFTCRYLVFGLLVPLACVLVLLWFAKSTREFRTVQQVLKFTMFMGVLFSYVIATNLTI
jgi:4-hydroxybenzoate polyprenyltransferase